MSGVTASSSGERPFKLTLHQGASPKGAKKPMADEHKEPPSPCSSCDARAEEAEKAKQAPQTTVITLPAPAPANPNEPPPPMPVISYKTPKNLLLAITKAGMAKAKLVWWKVAVMGFMAGMYIGVGALLSLVVAGGAATVGVNDPGIQKFLGGIVFPLGLMLIVIAGGELFTGNIMYISAALLGRKVTLKEAMRNWCVSYFFNFMGSLFFAYFLAYVPEMMHTGPYLKYIRKVAETKAVHNSWHVNLMRGIGCNWLVCASLMFALCADDLTGKILAVWWPVMAFITLGYEHCIANMFIIPLGLMEGADATVGDFIGKNLIPVTIGNILGGFIFVTLAEWVVFSDYFGERLQTMELKQGMHPEKTKHTHHAGAAGATVLHVTTPHPGSKNPAIIAISTPQVRRSVKAVVKQADMANIAAGAPDTYVPQASTSMPQILTIGSDGVVTVGEQPAGDAAASDATCYKCGKAPNSAECRNALNSKTPQSRHKGRGRDLNEMQLPSIDESGKRAAAASPNDTTIEIAELAPLRSNGDKGSD